jgi:hypothetical protein
MKRGEETSKLMALTFPTWGRSPRGSNLRHAVAALITSRRSISNESVQCRAGDFCEKAAR